MESHYYILKDMPLALIKNPNCIIVNDISDLILKIKQTPVFFCTTSDLNVIKEVNKIIGLVSDNVYIKNEWIYGDIICWNGNPITKEKIVWANASCKVEDFTDGKKFLVSWDSIYYMKKDDLLLAFEQANEYKERMK